MDAILALRLLAELHRAFNRPLHVANIDVKSAFDSVDRPALWKVLQAEGMPPSLLQLIRNLHTGTTARVRTHNGLSASFNTTSGVRQGCILAPDLFCSAIDWLMEMLSHLCPDSFGIEVAGFHLTDMDYADDAVLLTSDPRNWSNVLGCYEDSASTVGLHTNWLKTKIQNIGAGSAPEMVSMHHC